MMKNDKILNKRIDKFFKRIGVKKYWHFCGGYEGVFDDCDLNVYLHVQDDYELKVEVTNKDLNKPYEERLRKIRKVMNDMNTPHKSYLKALIEDIKSDK